MGVPLIAFKKELEYRRAVGERRCGNCVHFEPNPPPLGGFRAVTDGRCRIIGLKPGRGYQILPDMRCNRFEAKA